MNKKISVIALCVLLVGIASIVHAAVIADSARIEVSLISQEPDPVSPGGLLDVRFKVENFGGGGTEDIIFEILPEYPFSLYKGNAERNIGSMQARQQGEEGIIVHYELRVDENAIEGDNLIDIRYKFGETTSSWNLVKDFPIRVRTRDIVLSVESIKSIPSAVAPGNEFELSLTLRNNADSLIKDVTVNLDLSDDDLPFAPSTSTSEKQIYQIQSKTGKIMKFDLVTLPDAEGGIYKVPLNISYTDETGESFSKEDILSITVSSTPDLLLTIDSSEISGKQKSGEIVIKIVNRGLTNIKLLTAKLTDTDDIEVISEPEVYVGNIDSDDYETVEFDVRVKSYEKSVELPLELKYRGAANKQHQQKVTLNLKTFSKGKLAAVISSIIRLIVTIAIIIGIVFGVRWIYKKRKSKRKR